MNALRLGGFQNRLSHKFVSILARLPPRRCFCCICGGRVGRFLPYRGGSRFESPGIKVLQMVGSDIDHHSCPSCGCHDRERHLLLYIKSLGLTEAMRGKSLLHFAPELRLGPLIEQFGLVRYVKADLYPRDGSVQKVDLLNIIFPDDSFDYVIANHVLEHVLDDLRALRELYRVLKPGGTAILQTPYSSVLARTFSDDGIVTPEARLHIYGQEDHARIYGRDIFDRFSAVGFVSRVSRHSQSLPLVDPVQYGVNREEPLFLFIKPLPTSS